MSVLLSRAIFTISVDLETGLTASSDVRAMECMVPELLQMFALHKVPATWATADPAASTASRSITAQPGGHAIAILGDATWVGRKAGRGRFASELKRRITGAFSAGLAISTLALESALLDDHWDLAVKHGMRVVRQRPVGFGDNVLGRIEPSRLRFGLWNLPVSFSLPAKSRWVSGGGGLRTARSGIDEAISQRGVFHLVVDVARLAALGYASLRVLEHVLMHAASRRQQGVLDIVTLDDTARVLASRYQRRPSQSILHAA